MWIHVSAPHPRVTSGRADEWDTINGGSQGSGACKVRPQRPYPRSSSTIGRGSWTRGWIRLALGNCEGPEAESFFSSKRESAPEGAYLTWIRHRKRRSDNRSSTGNRS